MCGGPHDLSIKLRLEQRSIDDGDEQPPQSVERAMSASITDQPAESTDQPPIADQRSAKSAKTALLNIAPATCSDQSATDSEQRMTSDEQRVSGRSLARMSDGFIICAAHPKLPRPSALKDEAPAFGPAAGG